MDDKFVGHSAILLRILVAVEVDYNVIFLNKRKETEERVDCRYAGCREIREEGEKCLPNHFLEVS